MEKQLKGQATPEQIQQWKEKYKQGIYSLEVDGHIGYFKNPTRTEMNMSMSTASAEAALDMYDTLADKTFIGGSDSVIKDDQMFFGIVQELKQKMEGKKAKLVNL